MRPPTASPGKVKKLRADPFPVFGEPTAVPFFLA